MAFPLFYAFEQNYYRESPIKTLWQQKYYRESPIKTLWQQKYVFQLSFAHIFF